MQLRDFETPDLAAVHRLLAASGWSHRIGSEADLARLVAASQRTAVAVRPNGDIVGFARAITDGMSNGYLSMVAVAESFRRQGVGQALVERIVAADPCVTWVLRAGRDGAPAFFGKLGFTASTLAMERPRQAGALPATPPEQKKDRLQAEDPGEPAVPARPQISVRSAVEADAHTLAALAIQVWLGTYATEGVNDLLARYVLETFTPPKFAGWVKDADACLLVAEVDEHVVGYALLRFGAVQPLVPEAGTELCTLYVQEPFTGAGVGSALLSKAASSVRERTGTDALWLSVNVKNRRARGFYEKRGFVEKGRTHFVLGEGRHENLVLALLPPIEA